MGRAAAGALWMRGYFKALVMLIFDFLVEGEDTWLLPNPVSKGLCGT